jgi:hypothetical protein
MKLPIPIILSVILGILSGCTSTRQIEDRLVLALGEALYPRKVAGHVVANEGAGADALVKWVKPLRISFFEGDDPDNSALARKIFAEFAALTGVDIVWLKPRDNSANIRLHFSDEPHFVINRNEFTACYAGFRSNKTGAIVEGRIYIGRDPEKNAPRDCATHEFLHAFGWRGHTHRLRSAISYMHGENELTRWDRLMLRTHYDKRMEPGISKADALPLARTIFRELLESE